MDADARPELHLIATLDTLDARLRWLSAWTIHNANHLREHRDGLKVGGHQASCASISTIMTALYFAALGPNDRVAVKPHAGPVLHAIEYLLGRQTAEQLQAFRGFGGMQSYPSRTKDHIPVDFSTGSVGLGVAVTAFASLVQDYLIAHGRLADADRGRMIALMGDAELDEGNIYECLIEAYKHDVRNCWWIVDYNRQSLDHTTADRMFDRFDDIFATCGWRVLTLKSGKLQQAAFKQPGGTALEAWIDACANAEYAALTYQGGAAWRDRLAKDLGATVAELLAGHDDAALARLMTNLGGHCIETLLEAFAAAQDDTPTCFIAYTIKGCGLPFAGHKDNHAGLMNPGQIEALRTSMGIAAGDEWQPYAGLGGNAEASVRAFVEASPLHIKVADRSFPRIEVPARLPVPEGAEQSTQAAFGRILLDISKAGEELADHIVTTSPDVTVSTNLGAWVNQRGLFRRQDMADVFNLAKIPSAQKWAGRPAGQHIELGIAENNLFLVLAAAGLSAPLFGTRLLPVGTVYDPFIARGLDALNYGCYQNARFLLVATPSGVTLGPEGGAPVDQLAADRHGPARPDLFRARLRRRTGAADALELRPYAGRRRRRGLSPPDDAQHRAARAHRRSLGGGRAGRRLLAAAALPGGGGGDRRDGRAAARGFAGMGAVEGRPPRHRAAGRHLPRPPPPRLERRPRRPLDRRACRQPRGEAARRAVPDRRAGDGRRRLAGHAVVARRCPRPARQPARRRPLRTDGGLARFIPRVPAGRRGDRGCGG